MVHRMKPSPMGNVGAPRLVGAWAFPPDSVSHERWRRVAAFSLVELLVVVAILALLVGLMLPAITKSIEASSRNRCGAKVAKLALGMASYNSRHGFFPGIRNPLAIPSPNGNVNGQRLRTTGSSGPFLAPGAYPMPDSNANWFLAILPHVGLTTLYNEALAGNLWYGSQGGSSITSHERINQEITFCPSRLDHYNIANGGINMHYRANGAGASIAPGSFNRNDGAIGDNANGVFVSLSDVVSGDGSANTLLIAEGKRDRWMPWTWSNAGDFSGTHYATFVHVNGNNSTANPRKIHPDPGGNLLFGFTSSGTVNSSTAIVNANQVMFPTTWEQSFGNISAPVHPGGANVAFVDGSFRFLRQDLPPYLYGHLVTHRSVWDGSNYSTNSARANVFLKCPPGPTPYTPNPEDF